MIEHNSRITSLATVNLTPDQTVGASVNWKIDHSLAIEVTTMHTAAVAHGVPTEWFGSATDPVTRFKGWHYSNRIPRPRGAREIVSTLARHKDTAPELVSYVYSVNLDGAGKETAKLAPVGSVTFDTAYETFSWRFNFGPALKGEAMSDYLDRASEHLEEGVERSDLEDFAAYAEESLKDVSQFEAVACYSGTSIRNSMKAIFLKVGAYSMSDRGGFWYLPRTDGGDACPLTVAGKAMAAVEEASQGRLKFYRLTMPKDAATTELAGSWVHDGLAERIASLKDKVAEVAEVTKTGQHSGRLEELADIRQSIALYRDLLGLFDEDLTKAADEVNSMIQGQVDLFNAGATEREAQRDAKAKEKRQAKKSEAGTATKSTKGQGGEVKAAFLDATDGGDVTTFQFKECEVTVTCDLAFGYTYTITKADGTKASGVGETLDEVCNSVGSAI